MTRASSASSLDIRQLVCLAAVAELKTAAAAADLVDSSPSHVSSQVRALEQRLAVGRLIEREARGSGPTDAGQALLGQAYPLFRLHLALLAAAAGLRHARAGTLHFGAEVDSSPVPERSQIVERFLAENPGTRLQLSEGRAWEALTALEGGAVDVAMARIPRARARWADTYRALEVRHSTPWLLVPAWHRLAHAAAPPQLADLAGERLAAAPRTADPGFWDRCLAPFAAVGAEFVIAPEWSADALIDRVASWGDLTVLPDWVVPGARLASSGIVGWPLSDALGFDDLCIVTRAEEDSALTERFLATAARVVGREPAAAEQPDRGHRAAPFQLTHHARQLYQHALDASLLRTLVTVAETGSFSQAAAVLYTSQPWLSTQVRSLEEQLGLPLFTRTPQGVAVTPDGVALLRHAKTVLDGLESAGRGLASGSPRPPAPIRLGAPTYTLNLPGRVRLVQRLAAAGANCELEVQNGYGAQLISRLLQGTLDGAVLLEPLDEPGLLTVNLGDMVLERVMIPAGHPCARCAQIVPGDLRGVRVATFRRELNSALYDNLMKPLRDAGAILVPMNGVLAEGVSDAAAALGLPFLQSTADRAAPESYVRRPLASPLRTRTVLAVREERPWPPQLERLWEIAAQVSQELTGLPAAGAASGQG